MLLGSFKPREKLIYRIKKVGVSKSKKSQKRKLLLGFSILILNLLITGLTLIWMEPKNDLNNQFINQQEAEITTQKPLNKDKQEAEGLLNPVSNNSLKHSENEILSNLTKPINSNWKLVLVADLDMDENLDLVWRDISGEKNIFIVWLVEEGETKKEIQFELNLDNPSEWEVVGTKKLLNKISKDLIISNQNPNSNFYNQMLIYQLEI